MPHYPFCFADLHQDGKREVLREAGSESLRCGVIVPVISNQMCLQLYVCDASVLAAWLVLKFIDACPGQAEAVAQAL